MVHQASVWLATSRTDVFLHLEGRFVENRVGTLLRPKHIAETVARILIDLQSRRFLNRLPQSVGEHLSVLLDEFRIVHEVGQRAIINKCERLSVEHEAVCSCVVIDGRGAEFSRVVASLLLGSFLKTFLATHQHQGCNGAKKRFFHRQIQNFLQNYEK